MGTIQSIYDSDNIKITHISAVIGFFTCVDWDIFAQLSEYYTPLKSATLFFSVQ